MFLSLLHVNVGGDPEHPNPGRKWLGDVYHVHQRLWMAFPDEDRRTTDPFFLGTWDGPAIREPKPTRREAGFLFRIERDGSPRILVQSAQCPDWGYAFQNAPYLLACDPKVRQFDPVPQRDEVYRFRLVANVVRSGRVAYTDGRTKTTRAGHIVPRKRRTEICVHPKPLPATLPADPTEREKLLRARWAPWREWLKDIAASRGFYVADNETRPLSMETLHTYVHSPCKTTAASNPDQPVDWRYNAGLFNGMLVCTDAQKLRHAVISGIGPGKAFGFGLLSVAPIGAQP